MLKKYSLRKIGTHLWLCGILLLLVNQQTTTDFLPVARLVTSSGLLLLFFALFPGQERKKRAFEQTP